MEGNTRVSGESDAILASFDRSVVDLTTDSATLVDKFTVVLKVTNDHEPVVSGILDLGRDLERSIATVAAESRSCGDSIAATVQLSNDGRRNVQNAAQAIDAINGAIDSLAEEFRQVAAASKEIVGVIHIIEEIANQTKMLSLNAAIEAARAGEFGHGFAVVANEVRGLANNTRASAADISTRIERIVQITQSIAAAMNDAQTRVSASGELWVKASAAFEEIAAHAQQSKVAAETMMSESAAQSALGKKMDDAIKSLDQLRGRNQQSVGECNETLRAVLHKLAGLNTTIGEIDYGKPPVTAILDVFEQMRANNIMTLNSSSAAAAAPYIDRVLELDGVVDRHWQAVGRTTGAKADHAAVTAALSAYRAIRNEAYDRARKGDFDKVREIFATRARPAFAQFKDLLKKFQERDQA